MIELENLHVVFGQGTPLEKHVLRGVDLRLDTHEFVTVIGGNGAGKSTLLNAIAGDIPVAHGHIRIDGKDVTQHSTQRRAKEVSRVFQDPMLGTCATLTIEENLALAMGRGRKRSFSFGLNRKRRDHFRTLLADLGLGLENRLRDPMGALSGGQRQAISLLMTTLRPSKVLLLDEHTAALDPKMAKVILALTERLVREYRLTALMITHSMTQALAHGNRTLLLQHGSIVQDLHGDERRGLKAQDLLAFFE